MLGFGYLTVSVCEFVLYGKNTGPLPLTLILLAIGFGGLFIYNKLKGVE